MLHHEPHDERAGGGADGGEESPPSHFLGAFVREEEFGYNGAADAEGGGYADGGEDSGSYLRGEGGAASACDVTDHTSEGGEEEDGTAAESGGERAPKEGGDAEEEDLDGGEVAGFWD